MFKYLTLLLLTITTGLFAQTGSILFEENQGQFLNDAGRPTPQSKFLMRGQNLDIWIRESGISYIFHQPEAEGEWKYRLDLVLDGAQTPTEVIKTRKAPQTTNYYLTHCPEGITEVGSFQQITFKNIYPLIDWVLYESEGIMKYDFIVHPGGDHADIQLRYVGAKSVEETQSGSLIIKTDFGNLKEGNPLCFQDLKRVNASFRVSQELGTEVNQHLLTFDIANHNKALPLRIDPPLYWSTYFGGTSNQTAHCSCVDNDDNIFVMGSASGSGTFPLLDPGTGAYYSSGGSSTEAFIAKFDNDGTQLWTTFIGGFGVDDLSDMTFDEFNRLFVVGSSGGGWPTTDPGGGAYYSSSYMGGTDGVIARFSADGILEWTSYFSTSGYDVMRNLEYDPINGKIYTAGLTPVGIPTLDPGGSAYYDPTHNGSLFDSYVARFDTSGVLEWSTYLGGNDQDSPQAVCINSVGEIFIVGETESNSGFPVLDAGGFYSGSYPGSNAGFITKFDTDLSMSWSTYLGGSGASTELWAACMDENDNLYVGGNSASSFIPTADPGDGAYYDGAHSSGVVMILQKFNSNTEHVWGTYYGDSEWITAGGLVYDNFGNIYVSGRSSTSSFPTFDPGDGSYYQPSSIGEDGVIIQFDTSGVREWATNFGGALNDDLWRNFGRPASVDSEGALIVAGQTESSDFPTMDPGGGTYFNGAHGGLMDAVILKFDGVCSSPPIADISSSVDASCFESCDGEATASVSSGTAPYSYLWDDPLAQTTETATGLCAGTYNLLVTDNNGCESTTSITINEPAPLDTSVSQSGSTFTANLSSVSYQWVDCDDSFNPISGATNQDFTPASNGNYAVIITDGPCSDTSSCWSITHLTVSESNLENLIRLYPNPFSSELNVSFPKELADEKTIIIRDHLGRTIFDARTEEAYFKINLDLPNGAYLIEIQINENVVLREHLVAK